MKLDVWTSFLPAAKLEPQVYKSSYPNMGRTLPYLLGEGPP